MKPSRPSPKPEENPPSRIRLIILDVDGTLLDSEGQLREGVRQTIHSAIKEKVLISLASGRNKTQIDNLASELGISIPLISLGGACVSLPGSTPPLRHLIIPRDRVISLVLQARRANLGIMAQTFDANLLEADDEITKEISHITSGFITKVDDILTSMEETPSKITLIGNKVAIAEIKSSLSGEPLSAALATERYLDITSLGADKGTAVRYLLEHLQLRPSEVGAVGDGHNDISMFVEVGSPIAMGNSLIELKQSTSLVAPSNDEEGAAWAIMKLLEHNDSL